VADPNNEYGCLGMQPNPIWYYLEIDSPGDLQITISQISASSGAGIDVDFITYGPFSDITDACSNAFDASQIVDCSYSAASVETVDYVGTQVGEKYILLITNFSNQFGTINFSQTGGTATTSCDNVTLCPIGVEINQPCFGANDGSIKCHRFAFH
jgi:hypothetical protein